MSTHGIKIYVGVTDLDWFEFLSRRQDVDEVNIWQPGGRSQFRALQPGELFLFKLHSPNNFIVGGGLFGQAFTHRRMWTALPLCSDELIYQPCSALQQQTC
ncbi:hypothetical protein [Mesorhizobium sp. M0228]|uniref:hypothetical protein n=1 Tax=Mesorhizobium sp. M0228 TaxID=2956923 RepID=UPI00333649AE